MKHAVKVLPSATAADILRAAMKSSRDTKTGTRNLEKLDSRSEYLLVHKDGSEVKLSAF